MNAPGSGSTFRTAVATAFNTLVIGHRSEDGSSAPRSTMDFGPVASQAPPAPAAQGLRGRLRRVLRCKSSQPAPGALVRPPLQDRSILAGAQRLRLQEKERRFAQFALNRVIPGLENATDAQVDRAANALAQELAVLQQQFTAAGEHGLSIERVLDAMREDPRIHVPGGDNAELMSALRHARALVGELQGHLRAAGEGEKAARSGVVEAALILAMPGLGAVSHAQPVRQALAQASLVDDQVRRIVPVLQALDASFAGEPGYAFDRLLSVMCNHGRILESGRSPQTAQQALAGLEAMAATLLDAVGPGRDGFELNTLVGMDAELDKAIVSLRKTRVAQVMRLGSELLGENEICVDPAAKEEEAARVSTFEKGVQRDAGRLVDAETELARARVRLMRAFDRAGVQRPVEVIRGLKMDSTLVQGLANQLDAQGATERVGLAIMGVHLQQQDLANSAAACRMSRCLRAVMHAPRQRIAADDKRVDQLRHGSRALHDLVARHSPAQEEFDALVKNTLPEPDARRVRSQLAVATQLNMKLQGAMRPSWRERALRDDRAMLRHLQPRLEALQDPGCIGEALYRKLGLADIDPRHVRQLEKQGLSSAAEARTALHVIGKVVREWLDNEGPQQMVKDGVIDVLKTKRAEDRAVIFGERLLAGLRREHGEALLPPGGPARDAAARHLVRAAIFHLLPIKMRAQGNKATPPLYTLEPKLGDVQEILKAWGLSGAEVEEFGPIFQQEVEGASLADQLPAWVQAATGEGLLQAQAPKSPQHEPGDGEAQAQARAALIDALGDLKVGTRLGMTRSARLNGSTGVLGEGVGATVKVSASKGSYIDAANSGDPGDPYEMNFRTGGQFRIGAEASTPLTSAGALKAVAGGDAWAQRMSGVMLRCDSPAKMQSAMQKLMEKPVLGFEDLADIDGIMFTREWQGGAEGGLGVQGSLQPGGSSFGWDEGRSAGLGFNARTMGQVTVQELTSISENNKGSVTRRETAKGVRLSARIAASLSFSSSQQHSGSVAVAERGKKWEIYVREKLRVYVREGQAVDVESFDQASLSGTSALAFARRLGGPAYQRTMAYLQEFKPEVHASIESLLRDVRKNDLTSLAWKLDAQAGYYPGNAALQQSAAASSHRMHGGSIEGDHALAAARQKDAKRTFADRSLHHLIRVADVSVVETLEADTYLLGLAETSAAVSGSSLHNEVNMGGSRYEPEYAQALLNLLTLASRELRWGVPTRVKT